MKAILVTAKYIEEAKSVLLVLEKDDAQQRMQIHRNELASFGTRTEEQIVEAMHDYASTLENIYKGKEIEVIKGKE
jgi:hypothetical protein